MAIDDFIEVLQPYWEVLQVLIIIIIVGIIFGLILRLIRLRLLRKVKSKKQISNVMTFLDLLTFLFITFLVIIAIIAYYGNLGDLGFVAGLLTVALGFALQRPISSVVAWLIIITRHPFLIGDRIVIGEHKGEVSNITLTHIHLDEVGGTIDGEELSNRSVLIPNWIIFEQEVVNYNHRDEYILDEITTAITYESDLKQAETLVLWATKKIMKPLWGRFPKRIETEPHTRLHFRESGIDVTVRFMTIITQRNKIATDIRREIFERIKQSTEVEIAYPHTELLFREKNPKKRSVL